jgi:hypothetical protein
MSTGSASASNATPTHEPASLAPLVSGKPSHAATVGRPALPPLPLVVPLVPVVPALLEPPFVVPLVPLVPLEPEVPLEPLVAPLPDALEPALPPTAPLPLAPCPVVEGAPLPLRPSLLLPQPPDERTATATAPTHASPLQIIDARARDECARDVSCSSNIAPLRGNASMNTSIERRSEVSRRASR